MSTDKLKQAMKIIADFHIHSKYSRATSPQMDLEHLNETAQTKGVQVISTGDFTHPAWFRELKDKLKPAEEGLYKLKVQSAKLKVRENATRFILTTEISCIYSKNGKVRKTHILIFAPDLATVEKINTRLAAIGNLKADGRPILGLDAKELAKIVFDISPDCLVIPAHLMTPWFSLFGSKSGFDSLEECFEEYSKHIFAGETGLSADPGMLWRMPDGRRITLISNSDAHCVHPDTYIYSIGDKPKAIGNLNPSKVLSIDLVGNLKQRDANVSMLHKLSSPPFLYSIATQAKEIITTPKHRFFVLENEKITEKKASSLKAGDLVACLRQISNKGKSHRLPHFKFDKRVRVSPGGIAFLINARLKSKKTQKDIGGRIGVAEDCVGIFENHRVKFPKESFIEKFCECVFVDSGKFKNKFLTPKESPGRFPKFTNEKFCQILGYLIGDGGIGHHRGKIDNLSFTDKDINLLTCYQDLIQEVFNIKGKLRKKQGNSSDVRYPAYLAKYFQEIDPQILAPSPERQIPNFIFNLPKGQIASFLGGLFDAEGTFAHHSIQICSSSLFLVKEIQVLLLNFGITCNIYHDFEKNKKRWRYKISIYGQEQLGVFAKDIGFNSIPKKEKLFNYLFSLQQNPKSCFNDFLPLKEEILRVKKLLNPSCYDISRKLYSNLRNNTLKRCNIKDFLGIFSKCSQSSDILMKIQKFVESDIIWEPIQVVKKIKSNCKYVYDLTVPMYENYVANGFITHNSPQKIGREACVFNTELSYPAIIEAIKSKDPKKFLYTIEFFPEEGKYHYDGHRLCNIRLSPVETKKYRGLCPVCGKPLVIGVTSRVAALADRPEGFIPPQAIPYKRLIPLSQVIAEVLGVGESTKKVQGIYQRLVLNKLGTELSILIDCPLPEIEKNGGSALALAVQKMRVGQVNIEPGYDGVYGRISILSANEKKDLGARQGLLF